MFSKLFLLYIFFPFQSSVLTLSEQITVTYYFISCLRVCSAVRYIYGLLLALSWNFSKCSLIIWNSCPVTSAASVRTVFLKSLYINTVLCVTFYFEVRVLSWLQNLWLTISYLTTLILSHGCLEAQNVITFWFVFLIYDLVLVLDAQEMLFF